MTHDGLRDMTHDGQRDMTHDELRRIINKIFKFV